VAGGIRIEDFTAILILYLVHTTQGTTITERLPFCVGHLIQGFILPEFRGHRIHIMTSIAPRLAR